MLHVALFEPEIPPNTGNIIRLCANSGAQLHLIEPLGFDLSEKQCRRAGLDYHEYVNIKIHANFTAFCQAIAPRRLLCIETGSNTCYGDFAFSDEDVLLFGPETRGLQADVLNAAAVQRTLSIPMRPNSRSLNLSNSVAITLFEAWRQLQFA